MFEIDGDDILFRGVKVGHLEGGWPTLQADARDVLLNATDGEELENMLDAVRDEEWQKGYDQAYKELAPND